MDRQMDRRTGSRTDRRTDKQKDVQKQGPPLSLKKATYSKNIFPSVFTCLDQQMEGLKDGWNVNSIKPQSYTPDFFLGLHDPGSLLTKAGDHQEAESS